LRIPPLALELKLFFSLFFFFPLFWRAILGGGMTDSAAMLLVSNGVWDSARCSHERKIASQTFFRPFFLFFFFFFCFPSLIAMLL
jgi:hypothetical protein